METTIPQQTYVLYFDATMMKPTKDGGLNMQGKKVSIDATTDAPMEELWKDKKSLEAQVLHHMINNEGKKGIFLLTLKDIKLKK